MRAPSTGRVNAAVLPPAGKAGAEDEQTINAAEKARRRKTTGPHPLKTLSHNDRALHTFSSRPPYR
jgi:hypothetical protein